MKTVDPWLSKSHATAPKPGGRGPTMRLSVLFDEFLRYLEIERSCQKLSLVTYRDAWNDFHEHSWRSVKAPPSVQHFTEELLRGYQYALVERNLAPATIRLRISVLSSFAKWATKRQKLRQNPAALLVLPRKKARKLPLVPRFEVLEEWLRGDLDLRTKAILAIFAYGGLRRNEVALLDVADYDPNFGLRRVCGKGGDETAVALPRCARLHIDSYLASESFQEAPGGPLFASEYFLVGRRKIVARVSGAALYNLIRNLGSKYGLPGLHPHSLRHACGTELLSGTSDLHAVKEHLRHASIQTTTTYTHLTQASLSKTIEKVFGKGGPNGNNLTN